MLVLIYALIFVSKYEWEQNLFSNPEPVFIDSISGWDYSKNKLRGDGKKSKETATETLATNKIISNWK